MAGYTWSFDSSSNGIWVFQINENGEIPYCSAMGPSQANVSDPVIYEPLPYTAEVVIRIRRSRRQTLRPNRPSMS